MFTWQHTLSHMNTAWLSYFVNLLNVQLHFRNFGLYDLVIAMVFVSPTSGSAGNTNACSSNNGGCPHLCLPKPDNQKTCACTTGFNPSQDGSRCEQYESFAIVSTSKHIRGFHINSSDHSEAMVPVGGCGLALYWSALCYF